MMRLMNGFVELVCAEPSEKVIDGELPLMIVVTISPLFVLTAQALWLGQLVG